MELRSKFYLIDDDGEKFMGAGVLWLLKAIKDTGSVRKAALSLELSYTKATKMIKNLELSLNKPILEHRKGGAERQGLILTKFGLDFITAYDAFQTKAKMQVNEPYEEFCKEIAKLMED